MIEKKDLQSLFFSSRTQTQQYVWYDFCKRNSRIFKKKEVGHTIKILVGCNQSLKALLIFGSRTKPLDGFGHLPQYSQINTYGRKVPKIGYFGMGQIQ